MGRPAGRRSDDYARKRAALAHAVYETLLDDANASWSAMADRAGVSRPTLTHYFGDRRGAIRAALTVAAEDRHDLLGKVATMPTDDPEATLANLLRWVIVAWRDRGFGHLHHVGIQAGLADAESASTYLREVMDPLAHSVQALIERMVGRGQLCHSDPKKAALQLLGPVMLALIHQDGLQGRVTSPLDEEALARETAHGFLSAYAPV